MKSGDLRLLPIALGCWLGSAIGLHLVLGQVVLALAGVVLVIAVPHRHRRLVRVVGASLAVGVVVAALRVDSASPDALERALANSGAVRVEAVVGSEPMLVDQRGFGGLAVDQRYRAAITMVRVRTASQTWNASVPATVQWPATATIAVGSRIRFAAVAHPDDPVRRSSYRFSLRARPTIVAAPSRGALLASRARHGLAIATDAEGGGAGAALLPGLVLGDTRAQSAQLVDDLRASGLSHLTAVSGANLAIVIGAVAWLLRRTRIRARHRSTITLLSIVAFVIVVQPQPSVVRAAVMGAIAVYAMAIGATRTSAAVLWLSVLVLLIIDPFLAWQYGFALSVAATAGLIMMRPLLATHLPRTWLGDALVITLSAQLATLPLLIAMGRPPTWAAIPANLVCEPLVAPATVLGFLAAVLALMAALPVVGVVAMPLATLVAWPAVRIADVIAGIANRAAASDLAVAPITSMWGLLAALGALLLMVRIGVPRRVAAVVLLTALVVSSCSPLGSRGWPPDGWWYVMCDVGQGDASVLNLGGGRVIVVDAGPESRAVRACLRDLGVRRVEALFITHFHADHVEGVRGVVASAPIGRVYATTLHEPVVEWQRTRDALGRVPDELRTGDVLRFGSTYITVLWPTPDALDGTPNNGSLVLDVERGGVHLLLTGDADPAAQAAITLPVQGYAVLKVPHHGSRYQEPAVLDAVRPALALVSVGAGNDYGHPAADTLAHLRSRGARVLRTDLVGAIAVSVQAGRLSVTTLSG